VKQLPITNIKVGWRLTVQEVPYSNECTEVHPNNSHFFVKYEEYNNNKKENKANRYVLNIELACHFIYQQ